MGQHKIRKGLDLPILGQPEQKVSDAPPPRRVALLGADYVGMKPTMHVAAGDTVRRGQLVFQDKKIPGVRFTAPASGRVSAINRGARRAFQSLVIELDEGELAGRGAGSQVRFENFTGKDAESLSRDQVRELLVESGLWTSLRARPFGRTADPATTPHSIFVTAIDSQPLAADPAVALDGREEDFRIGLKALSRLTDGPVFLCKASGSAIPSADGSGLRVEEFSGPHPAGTAGLHIHVLDPVDRRKLVWHLGYQDTAAIGHLFATGELDVRRVVSVAGPAVKAPQLVRSRLGASIDELLAGRLAEGEMRILSGSVLSGRRASGEVLGYLGRYHQQISVVREDRSREFLGWVAPGAKKFSTVSAFASALTPGRKFDFTTTTYGSDRAMVPIGMYEKVMPMDIMPTFLLRALYVGDVERSEELGCLELAEEDLDLCTFVCPGKTEWGPKLRQVLTTIEKEG
ncbi:MAG: Na(+)-translocating NADH-quinone reductase subunit A [Acidobacteria bacterium]|nr:Na(+)-translocating NADH-quinone reductase subunit A [Acidobacteriota bacterium]